MAETDFGGMVFSPQKKVFEKDKQVNIREVTRVIGLPEQNQNLVVLNSNKTLNLIATKNEISKNFEQIMGKSFGQEDKSLRKIVENLLNQITKSPNSADVIKIRNELYDHLLSSTSIPRIRALNKNTVNSIFENMRVPSFRDLQESEKYTELHLKYTEGHQEKVEQSQEILNSIKNAIKLGTKLKLSKSQVDYLQQEKLNSFTVKTARNKFGDDYADKLKDDILSGKVNAQDWARKNLSATEYLQFNKDASSIMLDIFQNDLVQNMMGRQMDLVRSILDAIYKNQEDKAIEELAEGASEKEAKETAEEIKEFKSKGGKKEDLEDAIEKAQSHSGEKMDN